MSTKSNLNIPLILIVFLELFLATNYKINAQGHQSDTYFNKIKDSINSLYGLDPILYNGKLFRVTKSPKIIGHQFYKSEEFTLGTVKIRGNAYQNVLLNLDLQNQELLIEYNYQGIPTIIRVSKAWLEGFTINSSNFLYISNSNIPEGIYQVFGDRGFKVFYSFKKTLELVNDVSGAHYVFREKKTMFVMINNTLLPYHNNRSFIKIFEKEKQPLIKKYIKQYHINLGKAPDKVIDDLVNYCNSI